MIEANLNIDNILNTLRDCKTVVKSHLITNKNLRYKFQHNRQKLIWMDETSDESDYNQKLKTGLHK